MEDKLRFRRLITKRYAANGYPRRTIERVIYELDYPLPVKLKKILTLPFVGELEAGEIRRMLKKFRLSDILSVSFKFDFILHFKTQLHFLFFK